MVHCLTKPYWFSRIKSMITHCNLFARSLVNNLTHMISILNSVFIVSFYKTRWTKQDPSCICFEEFLNQLSLLYIFIYLYLQYILNFIFTVVFYTTRWKKQDLTCICFKDFLNQFNLLYMCLFISEHWVICFLTRSLFLLET
jgi:hypothetical protein